MNRRQAMDVGPCWPLGSAQSPGRRRGFTARKMIMQTSAGRNRPRGLRRQGQGPGPQSPGCGTPSERGGVQTWPSATVARQCSTATSTTTPTSPAEN